MKDLVIIGAGGFGREVQWLVERINSKQENNDYMWNILGYIDDGLSVGTKINGHKVLGGMDYLEKRETPLCVVCAIGSANTRYMLINKIRNNPNLSFPNLIDPTVEKSNLINWGEGNIVCAGSILTVNIDIANFCIINLDCTVGHDVIMESFVTVYPSVNISGNVHLNERVELGTGTQIIQGKQIGAGSIIGAGSVVVKNIPDDCTAVGSPCRPIKMHNI